MNDMSQETRDLYARTLSTMTYGLDVLRDEPDPDGTLADLAQRIEAEREWVRSLMASVRSRSVAPRMRQGKISSALASKLIEANCKARSPGFNSYTSPIVSM